MFLMINHFSSVFPGGVGCHYCKPIRNLYVTSLAVSLLTFQLWLSSDLAILFSTAVPGIAHYLAVGRHSNN